MQSATDSGTGCWSFQSDIARIQRRPWPIRSIENRNLRLSPRAPDLFSSAAGEGNTKSLIPEIPRAATTPHESSSDTDDGSGGHLSAGDHAFRRTQRGGYSGRSGVADPRQCRERPSQRSAGGLQQLRHGATRVDQCRLRLGLHDHQRVSHQRAFGPGRVQSRLWRRAVHPGWPLESGHGRRQLQPRTRWHRRLVGSSLFPVAGGLGRTART